jgi:cell division protein FtsQ
VRQVAYAPAKLEAAQGLGLGPTAAVAVAALVLVAGGAAALATGGRAQALASAFDAQAAAAGFKLNAVHIQGASPEARADILRASGLRKDQPVLGLDLEAMRQRVEKVGWVKQATIVRLLPDTVVIAVRERPGRAVWQRGGRLFVVDGQGAVIREADPARFPELPLVVGAGANEGAAQILPLVKARPRLAQRIEAIVRVDGRRWDLRLKDGGIIQLPAVGEEAALIQLDRLDQQRRLLELGFERIDLRDPELVAVRPRGLPPPAPLLPAATQAAASTGTATAEAAAQTASPITETKVALIEVKPTVKPKPKTEAKPAAKAKPTTEAKPAPAKAEPVSAEDE